LAQQIGLQLIDGLTVDSWTASGHASLHFDNNNKRQGPFRFYILNGGDTIDLAKGTFRDDQLWGSLTLRTSKNELMMTGTFSGPGKSSTESLPGVFSNATGVRQGKFIFYNYDGSSPQEWKIYKYNRDQKCGNAIKEPKSQYTKIYETSYYLDGGLHGENKKYFINGTVQEIANYSFDKLHGEYKRFNIMGEVVDEGFFYEGLKDGVWKEYAPNGSLLSLKMYGPYGRPCSAASYWYYNGKLKKKEHLLDNKNIGTYEEYYESGKSKTICSYDSLSQFDGLFRTWYENGHIKDSILYKEGKIVGYKISWHENGRLAEKIFYKDGAPDGIFKRWYDNGVVSQIVKYTNGVFQYIKYFDSNGKPFIGGAETEIKVIEPEVNMVMEDEVFDFATVIEFPYLIDLPNLDEREMRFISSCKDLTVRIKCDALGKGIFTVTSRMRKKNKLKLEALLNEKLRFHPFMMNGRQLDCIFDAKLKVN
jgi:antitoxin component YwqK of YwqJK toxin-antitoxin module